MGFGFCQGGVGLWALGFCQGGVGGRDGVGGPAGGWAGLEGFRVDHKAVADIRRQHALIGLVDLIGSDQFGLGRNAVLGAEIHHLLGFGNAADH